MFGTRQQLVKSYLYLWRVMVSVWVLHSLIPLSTLFFKKDFLCEPLKKKSYIEFVAVLLLLVFFGHEACAVLAP